MLKDISKKGLVFVVIGLFVGTVLVPSSFGDKEVVMNDIRGWWDNNWLYYRICSINSPINGYQMMLKLSRMIWD